MKDPQNSSHVHPLKAVLLEVLEPPSAQVVLLQAAEAVQLALQATSALLVYLTPSNAHQVHTQVQLEQNQSMTAHYAQ